MAGRPSKRMHVTGAPEELNLIPLMNVFCIIIPFLILFAAFVQLSIIETNLPSSSSNAPSTDEKPDEKPKLTLTVALTSEGFKIAGAGGVLNVGDENAAPPAEGEEPAKPQTLIPKVVKDGQLVYDFTKLQEKLILVKDKFPQHFTVILLPRTRSPIRTSSRRWTSPGSTRIRTTR